MTRIKTKFGFSTTAAEVLDGVDLTGKTMIVTGGASGIGIEALVRTGLTPHNLPADCSNDRADECSTWTNSSKAAISIAK